MWTKLNGDSSIWFAHSQNESYIYWNKGDQKWWIDGPLEAGVYIAKIKINDYVITKRILKN